MQKLVKRISLVMVALMTVFTALSYMPAKAATVVPKVQFVGEQKTEFTAGERVTFNLNASNYGGRVQYRVVLWNDSTKSYSDLWNTADKYYTNWMPYGNETLPLGWIINEPGTYRITVYAKRAGLANSKTALKGMNCDSYLNGPAFVVKPAAAAPTVDSIAPVADVTVNEGETPVLPTEVTLNLSDKTTKTAKVTWDKVDTTKVGTVAVAGTVEGTDKKASVNVIVKAVALEVKEVSAINLKEIDVKFNKKIDKDNIGEYQIDKYDLSSNDDVSLLEDGQTVRITLNVAKANQSKVSLSIANVKDVNGNLLTATTKEVTFLDVTVPTIEKVEAVGNKKVVITFTEPINNNSDAKTFANYKIDGKYVVGSGLIDISFRKISFELGTALTAGEHALSLVPNKLADYAGLKVGECETKFVVSDDKAAPTFTLNTVAQEKVVFKFNKEIKTSTLKVYWMNGTSKIYASSIAASEADKTEITAKFGAGTYLPTTEITLVIENAEDYFGNIAAKSEVKVTATADVVRPEVKAITSERENEMIVEFSKNVTWPSIRPELSVKDKNGYDVVASISGYVLDSNSNPVYNKLVISGTFAPTSGPYTVKVAKIQDKTALLNESLEQIFVVNVPDKTAPRVLAANRNGNLITIEYSEAVDPSTALDMTNYGYLETSVGYVALPYTAKVELLSNNKTVLITFPAQWKFNNASRTISDVASISIKNIKDLAGNAMVGALTPTFGTESAPTINTANAVDKNTINVYYTNTKPVSAYAGDFVVYADILSNGLTADDVILTVTNATLAKDANNADIIKLSIGQALNANGTYKVSDALPNVVVRVAAASSIAVTKTASGFDITGVTPTSGLVDNIMPSVKDITVAANKITVEFDEAITNDGTIAVTAADIAKTLTVKDSEGTLLLPGTEYTTAIVSGKLEIAVTKVGFNDYISEISGNGLSIKDTTNSNKANAFNLNTNGRVLSYIAPAAPTFAINYTAEKTNVAVPATIEYDTVPAFTSASNGAEALISLTPGTDLYFRVKATGTTPAGAVQHLVVAARPAAPTGVTVNVTTPAAAVFTGATTAMQYSLDGGTTWIPVTADIAAGTSTVDASAVGADVRVRFSATGSAFASLATAKLN